LCPIKNLLVATSPFHLRTLLTESLDLVDGFPEVHRSVLPVIDKPGLCTGYVCLFEEQHCIYSNDVLATNATFIIFLINYVFFDECWFPESNHHFRGGLDDV